MESVWTACWGAPARVALLPALPCVQEALEGHKCSLEVVLQALSFLRQLAASPDCKVCVAYVPLLVSSSACVLSRPCLFTLDTTPLTLYALLPLHLQ